MNQATSIRLIHRAFQGAAAAAMLYTVAHVPIARAQRDRSAKPG